MATYTPSVEKMYDTMSDGQWYPESRVVSKNARHFGGEETLFEELGKSIDRGEMMRGVHNGNVSYRMATDFLVQWRSGRGLSEFATGADMSAPRFFGGILEDDVWASAPLQEIDVVHFHATESASEYVRERVGAYGMVVYNFEGLVRIFTLEGDFAYQIVQEIAAEDPSLEIRGVRIDRKVRRREIRDLPVAFTADLFDFYGKFAHRALRHSKTSIERYLTTPEDVQQQIYLWVIDAIQRHDDKTNIPFAAYFAISLKRWVHDLPRKAYGRAVSDAEIHIARARTEFLVDNDRMPTVEELAETLNEPLAKVQKKLEGVSNVNKIRSAESLVLDTGAAVDIASDFDSTSRIDQEGDQHLLSMALTTSAIKHPRGPQVVGWLNIYDKTWGEPGARKNKTRSIEKDILENMREIMEDSL